jgi:hypothetical protein
VYGVSKGGERSNINLAPRISFYSHHPFTLSFKQNSPAQNRRRVKSIEEQVEKRECGEGPRYLFNCGSFWGAMHNFPSFLPLARDETKTRR